MQLLDAVLAFALTLAALATVVTIIMETVLRVLRMRRKNLVELMKLLNDELGEDGPLGLNEEERWTFLRTVVRNPAVAGAEAIGAGLNGRSLDDVLSKLKLGDLGGQTYDKVSLEHVLRRLAELPKVQEHSRLYAHDVKVELSRLALKFEEFGSAISANFKRRAQFWSIGVGVLLALIANVDGKRIFDLYLADEKVTQTIISKQSEFEAAFEEAEERRATLDRLAVDVEKAAEALDAAGGRNDTALRADLDEAVEALTAETSPEAIQQSAQRALTATTDLELLGVPIGWEFYPACPYGTQDEDAWRAAGRACDRIFQANRDCITAPQAENPPREGSMTAGSTESARNTGASAETTDSLEVAGSAALACTDAVFRAKTPLALHKRLWVSFTRDFFGFAQWVIIAMGTGLLIGLGAPFWFDVAKRLAQVRQMFKGAASAENRMSGNDADGNAERRDEIVERVVADARADVGDANATAVAGSADLARRAQIAVSAADSL